MDVGVNIIEWAERLGNRKLQLENRVEINLSVKNDAILNMNEDSDDEFDMIGHHSADILYYGDDWNDRLENILHSLDEIDKKTGL